MDLQQHSHSPNTWVCAPSSLNSYSTRNPDTVSEADTQETTKLLDVISVIDSEMFTIGGNRVFSSAVFPPAEPGCDVQFTNS